MASCSKLIFSVVELLDEHFLRFQYLQVILVHYLAQEKDVQLDCSSLVQGPVDANALEGTSVFIFRLIEFFRRYDSTWFWNLPALLHWSAVFIPGLVILIRVMFVRFQHIEVNNQFLSRSIYISYSVHNIIQCLHNDVWAFPGAMELRRSTSWYG